MFVTATLFLAFYQAKSLSVNNSPKPGAFLLAGGGTTTKEMVEEFAKLCGGKDGRILVLAQTREDPTKGASSLTFLKENGFSDPLLIEDKELSVERKKSLEDEFAKAIGFWVPGGNQNLVIERFGQKWFHDNVSLAIKRGANWFGTSAGAMVVSDPMIGGNNPDNSPKILESSIRAEPHDPSWDRMPSPARHPAVPRISRADVCRPLLKHRGPMHRQGTRRSLPSPPRSAGRNGL